MRAIRMTAGKISAAAVLQQTPTADAIWRALPIEASCLDRRDTPIYSSFLRSRD